MPRAFDRFGPARPEDRYEIVGELGRGGMGVVYRARDRESGREVALKVVLSELSEVNAARFQREGELTARLQHPAIVRIYSSGVMQGRAYLAYELIEGRALGELLPEVELRRRVELIRDAARGLGYAHSHGITHRDVKPDNILVGSDGKARVADFGLATARDVEQLTRTGSALGTPLYMSPEQIGSGAKDVGPAADTWSLGIILYEALAGRLPFDGSATVVELAGRIMSCNFEPPRKHNPEAPKELEQICLQALSRAPDDRYPNGDALADELDRYLQGESLQSRRTKAPGAVLALGVLGVALLAAGGWAASQKVEDATAPSPPAPVATETQTTPERDTEASRLSLESALERADPKTRHAALTRWLREFSSHAGATEAEAARDEAQRQFPVATLRHSTNPKKIYARFVGSRQAITFGRQTPIRFWDLQESETPKWKIDPLGVVNDLAVAPGLNRAILCRTPGLSILDLQTHELSPLQGYTEVDARFATFSADGRRLALIVEGGNRVQVVSWPGLDPLLSLTREWTRRLVLSADGTLLGVGGGGYNGKNFDSPSRDGNFLEVWNVDGSGAVFKRLCGAPPQALCFSPDNRFLLAGDTVGSLYGVELANDKNQLTFRAKPTEGAPKAGVYFINQNHAHTGELQGIAFSADGDTLFSISATRNNTVGDSELKAWSYPEANEKRKLLRPHSPLGLERSPDRRHLLTGSDGGVAEVHAAY